MVHQAYKNKPTVAPRYLHRQSQKCKVKSAIASDVMNAVVHSLQLYIEDYELKVDNLPDVDENSIQMQIEGLQKKMQQVKKKLSKAFDDYEEGIYTANEFVERKAKHNATLESLEKQIIELDNSIPEKEEFEEKIIMLSDALNALLDETLDAEVKNEYLKQIIDKIEFSRENDSEFILDVHLK
jgi:hypothetical protein